MTSDGITEFRDRHRSVQFCEFFDLIDARVSKRFEVHIIVDNDGTHKAAVQPRGALAELTMKQICRATFRNAATQNYEAGLVDGHQANRKPFVSTKSADDISPASSVPPSRCAGRATNLANHGYGHELRQMPGLRRALELPEPMEPEEPRTRKNPEPGEPRTRRTRRTRRT
jgi:hypothetical protein